jgi:hypothetical protein
MSIFGKIMGAIFGTKAEAATPGGTPAAERTQVGHLAMSISCQLLTWPDPMLPVI